jgi:hypothetical protein
MSLQTLGVLEAFLENSGFGGPVFSEFAFAILAWVLLHIALFYGLMTGLAFRIIKEIPTSFQARLLQPPQAHPMPPLPPPPLTKSRIEIPIPYLPPTEGTLPAVD